MSNRSLHITALALGLTAAPVFAQPGPYDQLRALSLTSAESLIGGTARVGEDDTFPTIGYLTNDLDPQFIPCEGDGTPLPADDVQGFLDACEAGMMLIRAEVSEKARAAAADAGETLSVVGGTVIMERWGEDICGVWSGAPFPLEGQSVKAFMESKAACTVLLDSWYEDVTEDISAK